MKLFLRRPVVGWAFYDFANSAFATTILAVIFNVYFVKVICAGGVPFLGTRVPGESLWGYVVSLSMLVVFLAAPVLGAIADAADAKKRFLLFFAGLGSIPTALLFFCREGDYWIASLLFVAANVGFAAGNTFYNALLQELSTPETVGRISGFGWALGYLGGGLLLALNLFMIQRPDWFSLSDLNHLPTLASIFSVAVWWALFSVPLFLWVHEKRSGAPPLDRFDALRTAFGDLADTFRRIRQHKEVFKYLLANLVYNDGIETVILMASIFGAKELGMGQSDLILCFLMIQAVAFFGALVFGELADRLNHKVAIHATLAVYTFVCLWGTVMKSKTEFWILGAVVGLILGGSQAASRSLLALLVPRESGAQFFGFFALTQKLATVIGPFVFALLTQLYSLRVAVGSLAIFFVAGAFLLHFVQEPERARAV